MYEGKIIKNFPFRQEERRHDMKTHQLIEELLFPTSINCIAKGKNKKKKKKKKVTTKMTGRPKLSTFCVLCSGFKPLFYIQHI